MDRNINKKTKKITALTKKNQAKKEQVVSILTLLKRSGIDITQIRQRDKLEDLLKQLTDEQKEYVLEDLQKTNSDANFPIGARIQGQREPENISEFKTALSNAIDENGEKIFDEDEVNALTDKKQKTKDKKQVLIEVLALLKDNGIDITKIRQGNKLRDILGELTSSQFKGVINQVRRITGEENFPIGARIQFQKRPENIAAFREALINELDSSQQHVFNEDEITLLLHKKRIKAVELGMATYDANTDICIEMDRVLEEARNKTVAVETTDKKGDDIGELS